MTLPAEFDLTGHTAIVASAGGDETPALAAALAEAGASVFAVARHPDATDAIRGAVSAVTGKDTHGYTGRWDTPAGADAALSAFAAVHPRADVLVNDTRSFFAKPAAEITMDEWDELHSRNVRATFMLSQAAGQRMLAQQYGRIVNVISNLAERGIHNCSAFSATQAAVLSLTRSLAVEWGRSEIRGQRRRLRLVNGGGHPPGNATRRAARSLHADASQRPTPRPGGHAGLSLFTPLRLPQRPARVHRRRRQRPPVTPSTPSFLHIHRHSGLDPESIPGDQI